ERRRRERELERGFPGARRDGTSQRQVVGVAAEAQLEARALTAACDDEPRAERPLARRHHGMARPPRGARARQRPPAQAVGGAQTRGHADLELQLRAADGTLRVVDEPPAHLDEAFAIEALEVLERARRLHA